MTLVVESQLILFVETKQTTGWNILGERYEMRNDLLLNRRTATWNLFVKDMLQYTRVESFKTTNKIYWNVVAFQHSSESPY